MFSGSTLWNDCYKTTPNEFHKIERIFVYANDYRLRNKVLDQIERGKPVKLGKAFDPELDEYFTYSLQEVRRWYVQHNVPVVYSFVQNPFVFKKDWTIPQKETNYFQEIFPFSNTQQAVIVYVGQWLERGAVNVIQLHPTGGYADYATD